MSKTSKGANTEYTFHTHPNGIIDRDDGVQIGGYPKPSGGDKRSIAPLNLNYGIVGGYNVEHKGDGKQPVLGFYNSKGNFGKIGLKTYKKVIKKINQ